MAKQDIRALTGLRGVAAACVVLYHFIPTAILPAGPLRDAVGRGYLCVDPFFVLSGFVIALNYGGMFAEGCSRRAFATFLVRRLARIYPLYIVVLLVQLALTVAAAQLGFRLGSEQAAVLDRPVLMVGANLLMMQSWGVGDSIVGTAWSVSTEWAAYLAFPLLAALVLHGRPRAAGLAGAIAALFIVAVALLDHRDGAYHSGTLDAYDGARPTPMLRCFGGFILGMLAQRAASRPRIAAAFAHDVVGLSLLGAIGLLLVMGAPDLAIAVLFPPLVLSLAGNHRAMDLLFGNPLAVRLGLLSYAIYLLHPALQAPTVALVDSLSRVVPPAAAVTLAGTVAVSTLLTLSAWAYAWVERPGRSMVRRVKLTGGEGG